MKIRYSLLICFAFLALAATHLQAQGTSFTYQGHLQLNGSPVSGSSDLSFSLFDAPSGGQKIGNSVIANDVSVTNGLFTVVLDFGSAAFNGSARWLQIEVRPGNSSGAFTSLSPRQAVTPTPYAIYAGAVAASGLSGKISGNQIENGAIGEGHLATTIGTWSRSGDDLIYPSGNILIGNASPPSSLGYPIDWKGLFVNNPTSPGLGIVKGKGVARIHFIDTEANPDNQNFVIDHSNNQITLRWLASSLANRWDALTIDGNGLVGIGDTAPKERLSVGGNAIVSGSLSIGGNTTVSGPFSVEGNATMSGPLTLNSTLTANNSIAVKGVVGIEGKILASKAGIGISDPLTAVHIVGGGDTELSLESDDNHRRWTLQANGGGSGVATGGAFSIIDRSLNLARLAITQNGNVGIGTISPATKLDVAGEVTMTACNITSDRNAKEQFTPVDALEVLDKVAHLPISEWQYKTQDDARHMGPMAQDFRSAFSLGRDEKHIATVDADGVALAAIQGLNQLVQDQRRTITALKEQQHQLEQRFEERLAQLEQKMKEQTPVDLKSQIQPSKP